MDILEKDIRTKLGAGLRGIAALGTVHERGRSAITPSQQAKLVRQGDGEYRGLIIRYAFPLERKGDKLNTVERDVEYDVEFWLTFNDTRQPGQSSTDFFVDDMIEAAAAWLRENRHFDYPCALFELQLLQGAGKVEIIPVEDAGTLHRFAARIVARYRLTLPQP